MDMFLGTDDPFSECVAALVTTRDVLHVWQLGIVKDVIGEFFRPMLSNFVGVGSIREGLDAY
jgi:hypothetical protein